MLAAQIVNLLIYNLHPVNTDATAEVILDSWSGQYGWRWMFAAETVPASLFFLLALMLPESPRWLLKQSRTEKARRILARIGGEAYADAELADIDATLKGEHNVVHYAELWRPRVLKIIGLGVFIAVFQQWCGINVIFN